MSKASPAASSIVDPSGSTDAVTSPTRSSDECPPETSIARHGSGRAPCSSWSTATCAARWLTPYNGLSSPSASDFAAATPTSSAPASPGPAVTAIASTSRSVDAGGLAGPLDRGHHRLEVGPRRDLGYDAAEARVLLHRGGDRVGRAGCGPARCPTPVSSHEVSMPRTSGSDNDEVTASLCTGSPTFPLPRCGCTVARVVVPTSRESDRCHCRRVRRAHRHRLLPLALLAAGTAGASPGQRESPGPPATGSPAPTS